MVKNEVWLCSNKRCRWPSSSLLIKAPLILSPFNCLLCCWVKLTPSLCTRDWNSLLSAAACIHASQDNEWHFLFRVILFFLLAICNHGWNLDLVLPTSWWMDETVHPKTGQVHKACDGLCFLINKSKVDYEKGSGGLLYPNLYKSTRKKIYRVDLMINWNCDYMYLWWRFLRNSLTDDKLNCKWHCMVMLHYPKTERTYPKTAQRAVKGIWTAQQLF